MTLYQYRYREYSEEQIICTPIEVKESPKTYGIIGNGRFANYSTRLDKDKIGTIIDKYDYATVLTEKDDDKARNILLDCVTKQMEALNDKLKEKQKCFEKIQNAKIKEKYIFQL